MATIYKIQFRRGTASEWPVANPILAQGEPGFESDTGHMKLGDGLRHWVDLPYLIDQDSGEIDLSGYAHLDSPIFVGNPVAPTPAKDDNDTSIATTAFVLGQAADTDPLSGTTPGSGSALRWSRADHVHPGSGINPNDFVKIIGDIMTGDLTIQGDVATPSTNLYLIATAGGDSYVKVDAAPGRAAGMQMKNAGALRWSLHKNVTAEAAGNVGSDLTLARYDNSGASLGSVLSIIRATGEVRVSPADSGGVVAPQNDTGWRAVTDLVFGWTASGLHIRRVGNVCYMRVSSLNAASRSNTSFYACKGGFTPMPGIQGQLASAQAAGALVRHVISASTVYVNLPTSITSDPPLSGTLQWFTDDPWPTTLTGTPYP